MSLTSLNAPSATVNPVQVISETVVLVSRFLISVNSTSTVGEDRSSIPIVASPWITHHVLAAALAGDNRFLYRIRVNQMRRSVRRDSSRLIPDFSDNTRNDHK